MASIQTTPEGEGRLARALHDAVSPTCQPAGGDLTARIEAPSNDLPTIQPTRLDIGL